ncbi:unnamed protein product [Ilex paraguariensis]|uniref:Mediator of RNA polymerase II transcription subunit 10 n=1 Tax=Ilex paraguariensis TaxID=185542 RepID=A0ABC8TIV1_9AQUA
MDSTATTATDDPKQNLNQVTDSIHRRWASSTRSTSPSLPSMNTLVLELDNMTKLAENCNIQVPMEVLNYNPDEFTGDVLNSCIAKNQITKGTTDAFKSLRRHLLEELEQAFPDEVEAYREICATSAAVSCI